MTRLGYQIPNFTYPDTQPDEIFDKVVAQAKTAEAAGYDRVMVMDHFYQLPGIGAPDEPMFECYSMLSALAQHTQTVRLSAGKWDHAGPISGRKASMVTRIFCSFISFCIET